MAAVPPSPDPLAEAGLEAVLTPRSLQGGRRRGNLGAQLLHRVSGTVAVVPLLTLAFIIVVLTIEAVPAIRLNGLHFLTTQAWNPGSSYGAVLDTGGVEHLAGTNYGALAIIVGTLESSAIALAIAVPVSVFAALAITEKLPRRLGRGIGFFLEVLAGIPSVIFGLWGALTIGPVLAHHVYPILANHLPDVPVLDFFRGDTGNGEGLLTSGIVLAVMVIPIVAATSRDLLRSVPVLPKEGALALGMSDWEVAGRVTLPWVRAGIIGASVLGLARALGETMAVAMVSGAIVTPVAGNIYAAFSTIAATIVSQLDGAFTDPTNFAVRTLAEAALVLAVITLLTNVAARLLVRRVASTALPVGRGV